MPSRRPTPDPAGTRSAAERRRWARAGIDIPMTLSLSAGKTEARVRDLSRAGVCFYLDRPIALMTMLELAFDLRVEGGMRHIGGYGAVVRCEKIAKALEHYEIAVFLHEMAEADRSCIEEYVAARRGNGSVGNGSGGTGSAGNGH